MDKDISVKKLIQSDSFRRWVFGKASMEEARFWDDWIKQNPANRQRARQAQHELLGVTTHPKKSDKDTDHEWSILEARVNRQQVKGQMKRNKNRTVLWMSRIAAVFLLAAFVGILTFIMYTPDLNSDSDAPGIVWEYISTDYGEQKEIRLSEGSTIILNAYSSLTYPKGWIKDKAIAVELRGEAYFSVSKRASSDDPAFKVRTSDGVVQVMGTKFIVSAEEDQTKVVLEEGAVNILKSGPQGTPVKETIQLTPDELAEFSRFEPSIAVHKVNSEIYTSWTRHKLVLDNTPFEFLVERIKKTYGVEVKVNDPDLFERRLTGTINSKSLDQLIQAVSEVLEISVEKSGTTVVFKQG